MANVERRYPGWLPWAIAVAFVVLFGAVAFIGGLGGRPKGDASGTSRALRVPAELTAMIRSAVGQ